MSTGSFTWTDTQVRKALALAGREEVEYTHVSTDTRSLQAGALFLALAGPNFDGHDFLTRAADAGAWGAVVSRDVQAPEGMVLYRVDDTLTALGKLARYRRDHLSARVVGITGSSGKTSTKEFVRAALADTLRVHATAANLNNRVGVPLTILAAPTDAQVVVVERGTNEPGEIRALTGIARPDVGMITTVSESHLDKLVDLEGVYREKLDLLRGLVPGAVALVGDTPADLPARARAIRPDGRVAGLGDAADAEFRPHRLTVDAGGRYGFQWQGTPVTLGVAGRHMAANAVLALAVARILDVPTEAAVRGVEGITGAAMRGEERSVGSLALVVDCYNANPQSTRAALDTLASRTGRGARMVFLGSMLELGGRSDALHTEVLEYALSLGLELVVASGAFARALPETEHPALVREADPDAAYKRVLPRLRKGGTLLLTASRGVRLERLLPRLESDLAPEGVA
ncbi:MAG TPA: UDP-N-acetylmuramoyl-tripeptide--D-alanyl-D-alanine ligase [Longimicrobiales bacterium]|nr:UDP-N-acetylmuramoyl-tripeptide--D-alanyl-D-alanine ligase [Longimicrobiales bacterium]